MKNDLPPPKFDTECGYFIVHFFSSTHESPSTKIPHDKLKALTKRQIDILDFIDDRKEITSQDIAERYNIDISTARSDLRILIKSGLLAKQRIGRSISYIINPY